MLDIRWSLLWFVCMDKDLENHFALICMKIDIEVSVRSVKPKCIGYKES
jgi:hypothetical protein